MKKLILFVLFSSIFVSCASIVQHREVASYSIRDKGYDKGYVVRGTQNISVIFDSEQSFKNHIKGFQKKNNISDKRTLKLFARLRKQEYEKVLAKAIYRASNAHMSGGQSTISSEDYVSLYIKIRDKAVITSLSED